MPLYQQQEERCLLFHLAHNILHQMFLCPPIQPEDSGLVPLGFLMLDLSGDGASSSTRTQSSESLPSISFHCGGLWSGLKDGLFFWAVLFLCQLVSGTIRALVRFWMLLLDSLWAMEIQGADWAPLIHGHVPLSLLLSDCCSSVPHQLVLTYLLCSGFPKF